MRITLVCSLMLSFLVLSAGCASTRVTNVTEGRGLPAGTDVETARRAALVIQVTAHIPEGAEALGPVEAGRGHRDWRNDAPTENDLISDLKISAYARGADGIAEIVTQKNTGLSDNFWWVLQARAVAWRKKV